MTIWQWLGAGMLMASVSWIGALYAVDWRERVAIFAEIVAMMRDTNLRAHEGVPCGSCDGTREHFTDHCSLLALARRINGHE